MFGVHRFFLASGSEGRNMGLGGLRGVQPEASIFDRRAAGPADAIFGADQRMAKDTRPLVTASGVECGAGKVNLVLGANLGDYGGPRALEMESLAGATQRVSARKVAAFQNKNTDTKNPFGYLPPRGDVVVCRGVEDLVFGAGATELRSQGRVATIQTPGGTGALTCAIQYLCGKVEGQRMFAGPICASDPSWPNYSKMAAVVEVPFQQYPYYDPATHAVNLPALQNFIDTAPVGAVITIQVKGHNSTGADIPDTAWPGIIKKFKDRPGEIVLVLDAAYLGLARGYENDRHPILLAKDAGIDFFVATSFSKALEVYGERLGFLSVVRATAASDPQAEIDKLVRTFGDGIARSLWSNPPRGGSDLLREIILDESLHRTFLREVEEMAQRYVRMRQLFVAGMKERGFKKTYDYVARGVGMFSLLDGITDERNAYLAELGVHMFRNRLTVAALTPQNVGYVCDALARMFLDTSRRA